MKCEMWHFQHEDRVNCVRLHDALRLITCSDDKTLRFWDLAKGKQIQKYNGTGPFKNFDVSPNKTLLVAASGPEISFIDFSTHNENRRVMCRTPEASIEDIRFPPIGCGLVNLTETTKSSPSCYYEWPIVTGSHDGQVWVLAVEMTENAFIYKD